jgi:hypothetical protein
MMNITILQVTISCDARIESILLDVNGKKNHRVFVVIVTRIDRILNDGLQIKRQDGIGGFRLFCFYQPINAIYQIESHSFVVPPPALL